MQIWIISAVVCALLAGIIGSGKGQGFGGWAFLGLLLGPIGVLVALVSKPTVEAQAKRELEVEAAKRKIEGT